MKYCVAACAVLTSLVLASPALAHHPTGSAQQVCDENTGDITLTASFSTDYEGETSVTATDSQAGDLGVGTAPASFISTFPGPSRDAGTVTFEWSADDGDEGTLEASYEAVSGCEGPPPPDNQPPPKPPENTPPIGQTFPGGPSHPTSPPSPENASDTLPFSGPPPVLPVLLIGLGLLGAGVAIRKLSG